VFHIGRYRRRANTEVCFLYVARPMRSAISQLIRASLHTPQFTAAGGEHRRRGRRQGPAAPPCRPRAPLRAPPGHPPCSRSGPQCPQLACWGRWRRRAAGRRCGGGGRWRAPAGCSSQFAECPRVVDSGQWLVQPVGVLRVGGRWRAAAEGGGGGRRRRAAAEGGGACIPWRSSAAWCRT
jgi:hypothetical protein